MTAQSTNYDHTVANRWFSYDANSGISYDVSLAGNIYAWPCSSPRDRLHPIRAVPYDRLEHDLR